MSDNMDAARLNLLCLSDMQHGTSSGTDEGRRGFTSRSLSLGAEPASSRLSSWLRITSSCCPGERGLLPGTSHLLPGTSHLLLGTSRLSLQEETHIH